MYVLSIFCLSLFPQKAPFASFASHRFIGSHPVFIPHITFLNGSLYDCSRRRLEPNICIYSQGACCFILETSRDYLTFANVAAFGSRFRCERSQLQPRWISWRPSGSHHLNSWNFSFFFFAFDILNIDAFWAVFLLRLILLLRFFLCCYQFKTLADFIRIQHFAPPSSRS